MDGFSETEAATICKSSLVGRLLVRLKELTKKPPANSNLSQILDLYINELNKSQHFISHGIFDINFAEAGLFLESCSIYYGKNVDLLWDFAVDCQKRIYLYEKKTEKTAEENSLLEERLNKYKRRRRKEVVVEEVQRNELSINNILKEIEEGSAVKEGLQQELSKVWKTVQSGLSSINNAPMSHTIFNADVRHGFCRDIYIDDELLCRYEDLQMNTYLQSYTTSKVIFDLHYLKKDLSEIRNRNEWDLILQKYLAENNLSLVDMHSKELWSNFKEYCNLERLNDKCRRLCPKSFVIPITRLGQGVIKSYLDKCSQSSLEENNNCKISLRSDSGFYEMNDSQEFDFDNSFLAETTTECVEVTNLVNPANNSQTMESTQCTDVNVQEHSCNNTSNSMEGTQIASPPIQSSSFEICNSFTSIQPVPLLLKENRKKTRKRLNLTEKQEQGQSKRQRRVKDVWLKTTSAPLRDFESFYQMEYVASDNEGCPFTSTLVESDDDDDAADHAESTPFDSAVTASTQSNSCMEPSITSDSMLSLQKTQRSNLNTWKSFIENKLQQGEHKADFDIHEYGTEIIDKVSNVGAMKFKDIVLGKTSAQVSRYFIASLQLANTYNIELSKPPMGLANDHLQFKFLSRDRYHESLDDYQAPSEESFRKKFAQAQATSKYQLHSTPSTSGTQSKYKRRRVDK